MSDVVLLRKLTRKSVLNFGRFQELTVQQCLDLYKYQYLRWIYFNASNITFMDDILDEIKITENFRIPKPSKNIELGEKLKDLIAENRPDFVVDKINDLALKNIKNTAIKKQIYERKFFTKQNMQKRNHGKI